MLDELIPTPRLLEVDHAELAAPPERVWQLLRHGDLAKSPLVRALFAVRTLPDRLRAKPVDTAVRIDDLNSTVEKPGFQVLAEEPPREFAVGAIGKVWHLEIPFVHVANAKEYAEFSDPGFVKVAWAIRVLPWGERASRVEFEVRVDATDDDSWQKFKRYFRLIGPGSHFIRRTVLTALVRELGTPEAEEDRRALPGDDLLPDASAQVTHGITIAATAEMIWPWLVQMGCRRAGFYAIDAIDNGFERSAREIHPELQTIRVGQVLPAEPESNEGFEVLSIDAPRTLVLGGLYDSAGRKQLAFSARRPDEFWQVTWAFVLQPLDATTTRLSVRARAAFSASERLHLMAIRPVHHLMQTAMLRHLAARAEGRVPRDDFADVLEGVRGVAVMIAAFLTPFLRRSRSHWGISEDMANRVHPGDELVREPRWSFTHGVEIDAPAARVWPWIAQIGADRAGFYSYQWLENLVGCEIRNAETIHPEWEVRAGQWLVLHPAPKAPRLQIVTVERGRHVVAFARPDEQARALGKAWASASWLFSLEPLGDDRCRFVSRYRASCSEDLATRLAFVPTLIEPVGFAMDRRMLLGVKDRAERAEKSAAESYGALTSYSTSSISQR
jgi:hypothetical protein